MFRFVSIFFPVIFPGSARILFFSAASFVLTNCVPPVKGATPSPALGTVEETRSEVAINYKNGALCYESVCGPIPGDYYDLIFCEPGTCIRSIELPIALAAKVIENPGWQKVETSKLRLSVSKDEATLIEALKKNPRGLFFLIGVADSSVTPDELTRLRTRAIPPRSDPTELMAIRFY